MENPPLTATPTTADWEADPSAIGVIPDPDPDIAAAERTAARRRARALGQPLAGLGRLGDLAAWIAAAQGVSPPKPLARPRAVLLAGDHGLTEAGMYPWPPDTTARRVAALRDGGCAFAVLARRAGLTPRIVDIALAAPVDGAEDRHRVRASAGRIDQRDALSLDEFTQAFAAGRRIADEEVDAGTDLMVVGLVGVGADTAAAVVVGALEDVEPIDVVDRGDGSDDDRWMLRTAAIRDALRRARPFRDDPRSVLRVAGGADLTALAGLLVQAALRRTPVVFDGLAACAAAMAAERIAPGARAWWQVGATSPDPAAARAVSALGLTPLLDLKIGADDGTGSLAAASLLSAAVEAVAETATAAQAEPVAVELGGAAPDIT